MSGAKKFARRLDGGERGGALVLSLMGLVVVGILSVSFMSFVSTVNQRQAQAIDRKQAFYLAEAGLAEAVAGMRIGHTGNVGTEEDPAAFGAGLFWVEAEEVEDEVHSLTSTGMAGGTRVVLSVVVEEGKDSVAALGTFAENGFTIPSGSLLDSYSSAEAAEAEEAEAGGGEAGGGGPKVVGMGGGGAVEMVAVDKRTYEEDEALMKSLEETKEDMVAEVGTPGMARVSSNGPIEVVQGRSGTTTVDGDVRSGPDLTTTLTGGPTVTGTTAALNMGVTLPAITLPTLAQGAGVTYNGATPYVAPAGEWGFAFLTVGTNSEVVLTGPATYLFDDLTVLSGGTLTFDTTLGPISVFVRNDVDFQAGSMIDSLDPDPRRLALQVAGTSARLHATGEYHGLVYAPDATVELDESLEYFGSLVGESLDFSGAVQLHFDVALGAQAEVEALPDFLSWRILEMTTPMVDGVIATNPFEAMGVVRGALSPPGDCHEDQWIDLVYYDGTRTRQTFSGMESALDWTTVKQVVRVARDMEVVGGVDGLAGIGGVGGGSGVVGFSRDDNLAMATAP